MNMIVYNKQYLLNLTTLINAKILLFTLNTTKLSPKLCEAERYKAYTIFDTSNELQFGFRLVERALVFLRRSKAFILYCTRP
jgi:hypothetical protein